MNTQAPEWPGENFVRDRILARQTAKETIKKTTEVDEEIIDIVSNKRGKGKDYDYSLKELAVELGFTENAYPEDGVNKLIQRAMKKFVVNYYLMLMSDQAVRIGLSREEADQFAKDSWSLHMLDGDSPSTVLKEVLDA